MSSESERLPRRIDKLIFRNKTFHQEKYINELKNFVEEMLEGILLVQADQLAFASGD